MKTNIYNLFKFLRDTEGKSIPNETKLKINYAPEELTHKDFKGKLYKVAKIPTSVPEEFHKYFTIGPGKLRDLVNDPNLSDVSLSYGNIERTGPGIKGKFSDLKKYLSGTSLNNAEAIQRKGMKWDDMIIYGKYNGTEYEPLFAILGTYKGNQFMYDRGGIGQGGYSKIYGGKTKELVSSVVNGNVKLDDFQVGSKEVKFSPIKYYNKAYSKMPGMDRVIGRFMTGIHDLKTKESVDNYVSAILAKNHLTLDNFPKFIYFNKGKGLYFDKNISDIADRYIFFNLGEKIPITITHHNYNDFEFNELSKLIKKENPKEFEIIKKSLSRDQYDDFIIEINYNHTSRIIDKYKKEYGLGMYRELDRTNKQVKKSGALKGIIK